MKALSENMAHVQLTFALVKFMGHGLRTALKPYRGEMLGERAGKHDMTVLLNK